MMVLAKDNKINGLKLFAEMCNWKVLTTSENPHTIRLCFGKAIAE